MISTEDISTKQPGVQIPTCCSPSEALAWVNDLGDLALAGDPDARRCLPAAVGHYRAALTLRQARER